MIRRVGFLLMLSFAPFALVAAAFASYVYAGVRAGADAPTGTLAGLGVAAPVHVARDARGIPHVRARNERDLFFADGYLQAADRLFQMDVYKRAVEGRLSEVFGTSATQSDVAARVCDVRGIARAELALLPPRERSDLESFAAGVNAAIRTRPLPPEFRALGYGPEPWTPEDSLVSSFATVLALTDTWDDVATRIDVAAAVGPQAKDAFFGITDPAYDAPTTGGPPAPVAPLPALASIPYPDATPIGRVALDARAGSGSNDFAAGGALTATHRALLANDPHLELRIPGVWWLADLEAPGFHAAGATFAGVPGIILGHNDHLAWGATNGTVTTVRVYAERFRTTTSDEYLANGAWVRAEHRTETIGVRFGPSVVRDFLRTRHGFVFRDDGVVRYAAAWTADLDRHSSFAQFDALDRAPSATAAFAALARYPGPPQNFVLADDAGRAGYVLAGEIPLDGAVGARRARRIARERARLERRPVREAAARDARAFGLRVHGERSRLRERLSVPAHRGILAALSRGADQGTPRSCSVRRRALRGRPGRRHVVTGTRTRGTRRARDRARRTARRGVARCGRGVRRLRRPVRPGVGRCRLRQRSAPARDRKVGSHAHAGSRRERVSEPGRR